MYFKFCVLRCWSVSWFVDSVDRTLQYSVGQHAEIGSHQGPEPPVTEPHDALGQRVRCTTSHSLPRRHLAVYAECTPDAGQHISAKHWRLHIPSAKNDGDRLSNSCTSHRLSASKLRQCCGWSHSAPIFAGISTEEYNGKMKLVFLALTVVIASLNEWYLDLCASKWRSFCQGRIQVLGMGAQVERQFIRPIAGLKNCM